MLKTFVTILVTILLGAVSSVAGENQHHCSNATLKGYYGFLLVGTKPSGPPPAPLEQAIGLSMKYFDGEGGTTQIDNIRGSLTGLPAPDSVGTGTYSINADCTGTGTLVTPGTPPLELRFVIVDNGKEVRVIVVSPTPVMISGTGKKL